MSNLIRVVHVSDKIMIKEIANTEDSFIQEIGEGAVLRNVNVGAGMAGKLKDIVCVDDDVTWNSDEKLAGVKLFKVNAIGLLGVMIYCRNERGTGKYLGLTEAEATYLAELLAEYASDEEVNV